MTKARELSDYTGLAADITAGDTAARAGRKNWIINGSVIVSQRASYATAVSMTTQAYYQDRWTTVINNGVAATIQTKSTDQPNGQVGNCIRVITSAGSSAAECVVDQRVENPQQFAGKTLTFSVWMKSNTNKAGISHYNNQDSFVAPTNHTGGGAWEKLTLTHTVNATGPTDFRLRLGLSQSGNTVVGVGDYFEVTEAQMEYGSVATDFEHRSYGEELQLCQRYFYQHIKGSSIIGLAALYTATLALGYVNFPVTMRAAPTGFAASGSNYYVCYAGGVGPNFNGIGQFSEATTTSIRLVITLNTNGTAGFCGSLQTGHANADISFSAEL
jgi:hypothetical protein